MTASAIRDSVEIHWKIEYHPKAKSDRLEWLLDNKHQSRVIHSHILRGPSR